MTDEAIIASAWPEWEPLELLGHGTYGSVWHVRRRDMPQIEAAVKLIPLPADESEITALRGSGFTEAQIAEYFDRMAEDWLGEIRIMKKYQGLSHFVSIEDCRILRREDGSLGRYILIRMEKLKTFSDFISDKTLSEQEVIDLGIQISEALSVCHADGLIHRDVKPENIFVSDRSSAGILYKLGDFGASRKMAGDSYMSVRGAPAYMAPEVMQGREYDSRADIYSLGLTLYRLMNANRLPFLPARRLFTHEDHAVALRMRLNGIPLPPACGASERLNRVLLKACAFDPEKRYSSAEEFSSALRGLAKAENPARSRRIKRFAAVLLAAALLAAGVLTFLRLRGNTSPYDESAPQSAETPVPMLVVFDRRQAR